MKFNDLYQLMHGMPRDARQQEINLFFHDGSAIHHFQVKSVNVRKNSAIIILCPPEVEEEVEEESVEKIEEQW